MSVFVYGYERGSPWPQPDDAFVSDATAWHFAGLVDGEGCFSIRPGRGCSFVVKLRADDREMLFAIRRQFGGIGTLLLVAGDGTRRDQVRWAVERKAELVWLTKLFDEYPLRSKKARDYGVWREAVIEWYIGMSPRDLGPYAERLRAAREYAEVAVA